MLPGDAPLHIETDRLTLASLCKGQGYRTAAFGKWHLGHEAGGRITDWSVPLKPGPLEIGFDHFFGMGVEPVDRAAQLHRGPPRPRPRPRQAGHRHAAAGRTAPPAASRSRGTYDQITETLTDKAVDWIEQNQRRAVLRVLRPHRRPPPGRPEPGVQGQEPVRHLRRLHRGAGLVRRPGARRPRPAKLADNTLVIFTSDNGGVIANTAEHAVAQKAGLKINGPLRGRQARHLGGRVPRAVPRPLAGQGAGRDGERPGGLR